MPRTQSLVVSALLAGLVSVWQPAVPAVAADVALGTGEPGSAYHQLGRAICRLVNAGRADHGVTCEALATPGGLFNLSNVRGGAIEFGLVPSDLHYHAVDHSGPFAFVDETNGNLRSVLALQAELITLVVRGDSGIDALDDLKGRRVNIGDWGSAQRGGMDALLAAKGWTEDDFLLIEELPASQQSLAFCNDGVDAIAFSVAHPDPKVARVVELCDGVLIGIGAAEAETLLAKNPYYVRGDIPAGTYPGAAADVATFGVKVTLVSSAETDPDTVYAVVKTVFENLDRLKRSNRLLKSLERADMTGAGLTAPLHEGARRYFEEAGMM